MKQKVSFKQELLLIINETENLTPNLISYKSNFTKEEYPALLQFLKGNQDIVFKTADNESRWVIMDKNYYRDQINVYKEIFVDSVKRYLKI